ncbi:MAG: hypothetical protein SNJ63_06325 [Sphingomonadaceae bacterium]
MLEFLNPQIASILAGLNAIYTPSIALLASLGIVGWALWLKWKRGQEIAPLVRALEQSNQALEAVRHAPSIDEAHAALVDRYQTLAKSVIDSQNGQLQHAWDEFEESLVDPASAPLTSTVHANEFFEPLVEQSRGLFWWANIMVAIGLMATFLGIMAALGQASNSIAQGGGDAGAVQDALKKLLEVTAAKFMTSVAGVGASIWLRFSDRNIQQKVRDQVSMLVDVLERGLVYLPPQRIAADQLRELQQMAKAQTLFAQDLAVAIGEKLNEQFQPVVSVLGKIDGGIRNLKDELVGGVGGAVANTLNETAGAQMQALATALSAMGERLGSIPDQIGASADAANARIENAAMLFSQASDRMQATFDELARRIEETGTQVVDQQKAAAEELQAQLRQERESLVESGQRNRKEAEAATEELRSLLSSMGGTLSDLNSKLAAQAEQGIRGAEELLAQTREALGAAAAAASQRFVEAASDAAKAASDATAKAVEDAMRLLTERIDAAIRGLAGSIEAGTTKVQAFGGSIERASASADAQAVKLASAGTAAERVAGMLDSTMRDTIPLLTKAGESLGQIAEPFQKASTAIEKSIADLRQAVDGQVAQINGQANALRDMASQFDRTAAAAQSAWQNYVHRFEQVDEALGEVLLQLESASRESAERLTEYANALDRHLADAVGRLAAAVDELQDLPDAIEKASELLTRD